MYKIEKKRLFLPLVLVIFLILIEEVRDFVYVPIIVFISFSILFWNYPWLVYRTVSKPFYYEDLFIDQDKLPNYEISNKIKKKIRKRINLYFNCNKFIISKRIIRLWVI